MKKLVLFGSMLMAMSFNVAAEEAYVGALKELSSKEVKQWASNPVVINAIKAQNAKHASLSETEIIKLDKQWRAETKGGSKPLIDTVMGNALSKYLAKVKGDGKGLYTEIFVMDNKGLNVGQSDMTSDYWQGDEAKWKQSYKSGANGVHIGKVEKDESTQQIQSQLSIAITDPTSNEVIGAVTVGVNLDEL